MNISVIIPARNEEILLPECLKSIYESADTFDISVEIIVVADCCNDRTVEIAKKAGCKVYPCSFGSRSKARNYGFQHASSDFVLFLDADTLITQNFFLQTSKDLGKYSVLWYSQKTLEKSFLANLYFIAVNFISKYRPTFSPAIGVRSDYFKELGGFSEDLKSYEDFYFLHHAWRNRAAVLCTAGVRTSMRRIVKFGLFKATLYFFLAWLNPIDFKWSPIHE